MVPCVAGGVVHCRVEYVEDRRREAAEKTRYAVPAERLPVDLHDQQDHKDTAENRKEPRHQQIMAGGEHSVEPREEQWMVGRVRDIRKVAVDELSPGQQNAARAIHVLIAAESLRHAVGQDRQRKHRDSHRHQRQHDPLQQ